MLIVEAQHREFRKEILRTVQVGGPDIENFEKKFYETMQVGEGQQI